MCNPCAEFFKENGSGKFVEELNELGEETLAWEFLSASPGISPGPVEDGESVRRRYIYPSHVDQANEMTPTCFNDLWSMGLSVDRAFRPYVNSLAEANSWVEATNASRPGPVPRVLVGLAVAQVRTLREIVSSDAKRAVAIFDTGLPSNPAHADVCPVGRHIKQMRRDIRTSLWACFRLHQ